MADNRKQVNVRMGQETLDKIEFLRANIRPFKNLSEVVRESIDEKYERVRKRLEAQVKDDKALK